MARFSASLLRIAAVACWSFPFLVAPHTNPIPTFYAEFGAAVCWIAFLVGVLSLTWGSRTGLPKIALAPLALSCVLLAQLAVATPLNPFFSFAAIVFLLAAAVACALGARCRDVPGIVEAIAAGLILGGLLTVVVEFAQLFRIEGLPAAFFSAAPAETSGRRMLGNLNQPNHVASYLAMGLAGCLVLAHQSRRWRIPLAVSAVVLLLGMALTFSRTAWVHLTVIGVLAGLIMKGDRWGRQGWLRAALPFIALFLVYQLVNWLIGYANVLWDLGLPGTSMGGRAESSAEVRLPMWRHAWHMFLTHPWLGGGWGDFGWNQFVQADVVGRVAMATNAHNVVLDLLAKVGLVGFLAVLLPCLGFMYRVSRQQLTSTRAFFYAIVLILAMHSMVEFPLHYLFFLLPFAFALGYADEHSLRVPSGSMSWTLMGVVALGSVALTGRMWLDYRSVERLYAPTLGIQQELARYQAQGQVLFVPYGSLVLAMRAPIAYEMAPVMAAVERQAAQFLPQAANVQGYALALALQGKTDEAVAQVRRLKNIYWLGVAEHTTALAVACTRNDDHLKTFCARIESEKLLDDAPAQTQ